jgi:hypothetical protein
MRNSLLPILLLLLTVGASLWLIRGGVERGAGGPAVYPGIFKLPVKIDKMTPSAQLQGNTTHQGQAPAGASDWRIFLVSGDDGLPLTNTALLALGEELTRRGCIAVLEPGGHEAFEPLPLAADVNLRLTTMAESLPTGGPGAIAFTTSIQVIPTRVPAGHPAGRWFPDLPDAPASTVTIAHSSTPSAHPAWPSWYAAIGRAVAGELIATLGTPKEVTDTAAHIRETAWVLPTQTSEASPFGRIPAPPQGDVLERRVPFQHPFVRGWIGYFSPVPVTTHDGGKRAPRDELLRRLERGGWNQGPKDGDTLIYTKDDKQTDGSDIHRALTITGEQVIEWQERPHPTALWQTWQEAAKAGNAEAAAQLARHRTTAGIPADLKTP